MLVAEGDEVVVRVGGDCTLDVAQELGSTAAPDGLHLLLVAAGIGITPLLSMMRHADEWLCSEARAGRGRTAPLRVSLLYSATGADELAYRAELTAIAARHPDAVDARFFVSRGGGGDVGGCRGIEVDGGDVGGVGGRGEAGGDGSGVKLIGDEGRGGTWGGGRS